MAKDPMWMARKIVVHVRKISLALKVSGSRVGETTVALVPKTSKSKVDQGPKDNNAKAVQDLKAKKIADHARRISRSKAVQGPKVKRIVAQDRKTRKIVVQGPTTGKTAVQGPKAKISAVQSHRIRNATKASRRSSSRDASKVQDLNKSRATKADKIRIPVVATSAK